MRTAVSRQADPAVAAADVAAQLRAVDAALVLVFVSPRHDRDALANGLNRAFGDTPVVGCTTAGEITPLGYESGTLTAVAFPRRHFRVRVHLLERLVTFSIEDGLRWARAAVSRFGRTAGWHGLALLLTDGHSRREEALLAALEPGLAPFPIIGGSAGDGLDFGPTHVVSDGRFHSDAAVLILLETNYLVTELRFDHFLPTETRIVVTAADPDRRLVHEINAEPAAEAYARAVGCAVDDLSPFVFATRPTLVRVSNTYHVRAIQKVEPGLGLRFYCAIDEGLVMTIGQAQDLVSHLDRQFADLTGACGKPVLVLGFDCMLRRLEAELLRRFNAVSDILSQNRVVGFSTYGEQFHGMHVNQTFVGVAFHRPPSPVTGEVT